ncbi:MAG: hypothetical protein IJ356_11510 [Erysipelotrichaceae bacterium]|nr:hypothetical protein [Erysipelotrichaceae bacterium]
MMGLQLIFVVETNKKCKSDWIYIKDTIDCFYQYDQQVKLSVVYMDGKKKYKKKQKEILSLISQYCSRNKDNQSKVLFCFDCDDYDSNPEDNRFIEEVKEYCAANGYDFIWFCKDIECVYLGEKVDKKLKKKASESFKSNKMIQNVQVRNLSVDSFQDNTSNILNVLDTHLRRR